MGKEFSIGMKGEGSKGKFLKLPLDYPVGKHLAEIMAVEFVPGEQVKSGNPYFLWALETTEERIPFEVVTTTKEGSRWLLKQILSACGIEAQEDDPEEKYDFSREDTIGKIVLFTVIHRENTFSKKEEAEVNRFEKIEEEKEEQSNPVPLAKNEEKELAATKSKIIKRLLELADKQDITAKGVMKKVKKFKPKFDIEKGLLTELSLAELEKLENEIKNEVPFGNE